MTSKLPKLTAGRPWRFRDLQLHVVLLHLGRRIQNEVRVGVAGQPDIEAGSGQGFHLASQELLVGRGLGQDVVRMDKGPALRLAQPIDFDAGKLLVPALPGRQDPPVAIDQVPGGVDASRHDPPELIKAAYKFVELRLRVLLRVSRVGDQLVDLPPDQADRRFCHISVLSWEVIDAGQDRARQQASLPSAGRCSRTAAPGTRQIEAAPRVRRPCRPATLCSARTPHGTEDGPDLRPAGPRTSCRAQRKSS